MSGQSCSRRCGCDEDKGDERWIQPVTVAGDSRRTSIVEKGNHVVVVLSRMILNKSTGAKFMLKPIAR
eukprot:4542829-Karenia_brevis.AAC.1